MIVGINGECEEICGDGLDYGFNECEDGNKEDGDGCSSQCKIETNYKCVRGTYTSKGSCTAIPY